MTMRMMFAIYILVVPSFALGTWLYVRALRKKLAARSHTGLVRRRDVLQKEQVIEIWHCLFLALVLLFCLPWVGVGIAMLLQGVGVPVDYALTHGLAALAGLMALALAGVFFKSLYHGWKLYSYSYLRI